jgi:hypothetical protein
MLVESTQELELAYATHPMEGKPHQDPCEEPQVSFHDLCIFSATQTLKLIGYIKDLKVMILIGNSNTHNFIHKRVIKETHCFVHTITSFKIIITNVVMIKCGR